MKKLQTTITSKGQITIPSYIREKLHLVSGNKLEFVIGDNSFVVIPINKSAKSLRGILPKPGRSFTIEEMNETIKDAYGRD
jgi:antitoxin PrlF